MSALMPYKLYELGLRISQAKNAIWSHDLVADAYNSDPSGLAACLRPLDWLETAIRSLLAEAGGMPRGEAYIERCEQCRRYLRSSSYEVTCTGVLEDLQQVLSADVQSVPDLAPHLPWFQLGLLMANGCDYGSPPPGVEPSQSEAALLDLPWDWQNPNELLRLLSELNMNIDIVFPTDDDLRSHHQDRFPDLSAYDHEWLNLELGLERLREMLEDTGATRDRETKKRRDRGWWAHKDPPPNPKDWFGPGEVKGRTPLAKGLCTADETMIKDNEEGRIYVQVLPRGQWAVWFKEQKELEDFNNVIAKPKK